MNEAKHTLGPWVAAEGNNRGHVMTLNGGYAIHEHPDFSSIGDRSQITANARLIAAAPDLLDALQCLMDHFDKASYDAAFEKARAAIAKATGAA